MMAYERAYAQVDTEAIKHNVLEIRKKAGERVKIMQVIKADAYGHGAKAVARALDNLVDYFAVAIIEEALELRKSGIIKPILVFGFVAPEAYGGALEHQVTQAIFSLDMAKQLSNAAVTRGVTGKVHIVLDTGMTRVGFDCSAESIEIICEIARLPGICIEGIFTHYATADEGENEFVRLQQERFRDICRRLENAGVNIPIRHICNSAGLLDYSESHLDMVRPGLITYGLYPSREVRRDEVCLKPALEFKTHIIHIKTVPADVGVSYGREYVTERETVVATIPVGYADGYPRSLSGKGRVLIRGEYAPIIGRICMDQFMVDVSHISGVQVGDDVTLIGRDGAEYISVEEIAEHAGTINYEIVCGIGKRVPRIYK